MWHQQYPAAVASIPVHRLGCRPKLSLLLRNRWALPCSSVMLAVCKVIPEPMPELWAWAVMLDCKVTLAFVLVSQVLGVMVGSKVIP